MDVRALARKNLISLDGYIDVKDENRICLSDFLLNFQVVNEDEQIIGFYRNKFPEHVFIVITSQRMVICDLDRSISIKYNDIESVHIEPSKNTNKIFVRQKDGSSYPILVSGIKGDKFLDIYGFLRFMKKIVININLNNAVSLAV
jgi:Bacterial PH domain